MVAARTLNAGARIFNNVTGLVTRADYPRLTHDLITHRSAITLRHNNDTKPGTRLPPLVVTTNPETLGYGRGAPEGLRAPLTTNGNAALAIRW